MDGTNLPPEARRYNAGMNNRGGEQNQATSITVSILDNDTITTQALAGILGKLPHFSVLWTANTAQDALVQCLEDERWPSVILADISLSGMSGLDFCRTVRLNDENTPVLAMTSFPLEQYAQQASDAGAQGIVSKTNLPVLVKATQALASGRTWPCAPGHAPVAFLTTSQAHDMLRSAPTPDYMTLSRREVQVLELTMSGFSQEQVAGRMGITSASVRTHSRIARQKLHADTLPQAVAIWMSKRTCYRKWLVA